MEKVKPTILEPIMDVEITAPQENSGDIMGDLNSRRGRVQGMETRGKNQVIKAQVPMSEMLDYQSTLNSITAARGSFHMQFSHYDPVPGSGGGRRLIIQNLPQNYEKHEDHVDPDNNCAAVAFRCARSRRVFRVSSSTLAA
jgi:translation elongation factor EF-G